VKSNAVASLKTIFTQEIFTEQVLTFHCSIGRHTWPMMYVSDGGSGFICLAKVKSVVNMNRHCRRDYRIVIKVTSHFTCPEFTPG